MTSDLLLSFERNEKIDFLRKTLNENPVCCINPEKLAGSALAFIASALVGTIHESSLLKGNHLFIIPDAEESIYFSNDLENLLPGRNILYYPSITPAERAKDSGRAGLLKKTEILNIIRKEKGQIIVASAAALCEKVADSKVIEENTFVMEVGSKLSMDFVVELLAQYNFERTDFVADPGQYSRRGGILDVFSFSDEHPFRLEFLGDEVESIRLFDASTQLSLKELKKIEITPNLRDVETSRMTSLLAFLKASDQTYLWIKDYPLVLSSIEEAFNEQSEDVPENSNQLISSFAFDEECKTFSRVVWGLAPPSVTHNFTFPCSPQKSFGKNFNLFFDEIHENVKKGYRNYIFTDTEQQMQRLKEIFSDARLQSEYPFELDKVLIPVFLPIYQGFTNHDTKTAFYTDHELFGRYHRFRLKDTFYKSKEALTLKELQDLKPGDFVTHIDYGVGRFAGLDKVDVNGNMQEVVRILYKDNDLLLVSIHSLHRISRYSSKEGHQPTLDKLGSANWKALKQKTKRRIKELAFDLVKIYAERKSREGFAFHPDTYLQNELEASFIYEDTPDQVKATRDVKKDMESPHPMDRLVCGDVGFGKTEIAIRAAFKAVSDSKQVAVLVPTTILALQHFKTFSERLMEFPCNIDYLNRFRTSKDRTQVLKNLEAGKIDIIIGTHQLVNKELKFKDLGLLIVDEEQKFGVGVKDKLKTMRSTVDILTLTATPIPRTLQFSLVGIRDMSVINTPPPNRYPVKTEVCVYSDDVFRNAINYEVARGGQVFVIHNRVQSIQEVATLIRTLCPNVRVGIAHGQLKGHQLEEVMLQFIEGEIDVLVSTAIVESGLDIPNLNTIIIHDAHIFGLSDLHQLRGRVGRSNKKAFCYLVVPSFETLTRDAHNRLDALEQFSDLGSGFSIAMRDLDIRGAGDLLGGEQSGFVNDMGIDTYHKILNEAIEELKEEIGGEALVSMGIKTDEPATKKFVKDCHVETDATALLPDDYVHSSEERLRLYRELNEAKDEDQMTGFEAELIDRFGKLPASVQELTNVVRLRLIASELGIERIVFKNKVFHCFFISQTDSPFYSSNIFTNIIEYIKKHSTTCKINQGKDKFALAISPVKSVSEALKILREMRNDKS